MDETSTTKMTDQPEARRALMDRVQGAILALRRGDMIRIVSPQGAYLCLSTEQVQASTLSRLRQLGIGDPFIALTANRAAVLHIPPTGKASICLPIHDLKIRAIKALADPTKDLVNPFGGPYTQWKGEVSPAIDNGIKFCKLAQLLPSIVAIKAGPEDGHDSILTLTEGDADLYETVAATTLQPVSSARVPLAGAENTQVIAYRPADGGVEHLAIIIGDLDVKQPVLIRMHSECFTGDLLGSLKCDCGEQLRGAIEEIGKAGSGILLYLSQEGRGIGLMNKLRAYHLQDDGYDTIEANERIGFEPDERVFLPAAEMLRHLGVRQVALMTNNPDKVAQLAGEGIEVVERVPHEFESNAHNEQYLDTKAKRSGHYLRGRAQTTASGVGMTNPPDDDL